MSSASTRRCSWRATQPSKQGGALPCLYLVCSRHCIRKSRNFSSCHARCLLACLLCVQLGLSSYVPFSAPDNPFDLHAGIIEKAGGALVAMLHTCARCNSAA